MRQLIPVMTLKSKTVDPAQCPVVLRWVGTRCEKGMKGPTTVLLVFAAYAAIILLVRVGVRLRVRGGIRVRARASG